MVLSGLCVLSCWSRPLIDLKRLLSRKTLLGSNKAGQPSKIVARHSTMLILEPRVMLDAAALMTAEDTVQDGLGSASQGHGVDAGAT
jgi:hypothetical protein